MTTQNPSTQARVARSSKRPGKAKYVFLLGAVLVVLLAVQTGVLGFGLARLRAATFPRDESLLEYIPASAGGVVILDPHQFALNQLGAPTGTVRQHIDRTRDDIKKATGIDLTFDVDKLAWSPALIVARGRFNEKKLAERLAEHSYAPAEYKGLKYLVRPGEDGIAVLDDSVILYGTEAEIRAGIDAKFAGTSLASREEVTGRLGDAGWNHPILAIVQLADSKPSIRNILTGSTGPRAITLSLSMKGGLFLAAAVDAASPEAAQELRKLLDEKRMDADALKSFGAADADAGPVLVGIAQRATLAAEQGSSRIAIRVDIKPAELDTLASSMQKSMQTSGSFAAVYKDVHLLQLLMPGR